MASQIRVISVISGRRAQPFTFDFILMAASVRS